MKQSANSYWVLVFLLSLLAMIGPFTIDAYLPVFKAIEADFQVNKLTLQQTLTVYMLTFSVMILWHGALADRFGRKRVLLFFMSIYIAGSLYCALADSIYELLVGRFIQGLSAGSGVVVSRAIVRDLYEGVKAQKLMATIAMMFSVAPVIGPVVGGWVQVYFNWHGIFVFLAMYGVLLWFFVWHSLPETLPVSKRKTLRPASLAKAYFEILTHASFVLLSFSLAFSFSGFFVYIVSTPVFLMDHLGLSETQFFWFFAPATIGFSLGSFLAGQAVERISRHQLIKITFFIMLLASIINMLYGFIATAPVFPWAILPLVLYAIGIAMLIPILMYMTTEYFPERFGTASSCQGFIQTTLSALVAAFIAPISWASVASLSLAMFLLLVAGLVCYVVFLKLQRNKSGHNM